LDPLTTNYSLSYAMRWWQPIYHFVDHESDIWQPGWGPRVARLFEAVTTTPR
jgi:hypothetical protein